MANITKGIRVSNTNGYGDRASCVRVYIGDHRVAEVYINKRNPLAYCQARTRFSGFAVELQDQLTSAMQEGLMTNEQRLVVLNYVYPGLELK